MSEMTGELLHGTSVANPAVYVAVIAVVLVAAFVASWIPARRAARIDPMVAIREE